MLKYNFIRIFNARGIERPFSYLTKNGFTSNVATRIANSTVDKISLVHITKLCEILNCTPSDFFEYTPSNQNLSPTHALHTLNRKDSTIDLSQLTRNLPIDKLQQITQQILNSESNPNPS